MSSAGRSERHWRSTVLVTIVLFVIGVSLIGRGLVPAVPLVYGGSEEEAAQRDAGLIQLALGCGSLAALGIVLAHAGGRPIGVALVTGAVATTILGLAGLGWTWISTVALIALALGGTAWASKQWWASRRPGRYPPVSYGPLGD